jgi:RNase adaptor protein for sRNA GlmZ degradation
MKLVFIYGAPAVGKLTVAQEIARRTGFKVFHNHLSIDCIEPIFEFGTKSFWKIVELIRLETIAEAARENVNLLYTFCYAKGEDDKHIQEVIERVEANGGEICFVLLRAEKSALEKRVINESRRKFNKANDMKVLNEILNKYDLFSPVPGRQSLQIDNTSMPPQKVAEQIIRHFNLQPALAKKKD